MQARTQRGASTKRYRFGPDINNVVDVLHDIEFRPSVGKFDDKPSDNNFRDKSTIGHAYHENQRVTPDWGRSGRRIV